MTRQDERTNPFTQFIKKNYMYILAFALPAFIMWTVYLIFGVYPSSNNSVLALDLNAQYANYFDYIYDVFAGRESLFYSWSRNLSGEFFGIIGYYLASPFNFLVWLFPREHLTEGLLIMILSKIGTAGLFTAIYLGRGRKLSPGTALVFSMLYALCAYTVTQTLNPMWLDGVLILPLVVYGIESLVNKGHFRLLIGALIYAFVTNFYIGFMIAIFTALYFIYYFLACKKLMSMSFEKALMRAGLAILSAAAALACSAFMLVPVYNSLSLGKFDFSQPDKTIKPNFNLVELADKFLPNSYDTVRMSGTPLIYCGVLTVILVVCYFIGSGKKGVSGRKRICGAALLLILAASMYIRPVDMYWHGGQFPNWLPYRYSFMFSFLLVIWAAEAFERISDFSKRTIGGAACGFFAVMIFLENKDNFDPELGNKGRELLDGITVILPAVLILFILAAIVVQLRDKINRNVGVTALLVFLTVGELFYNSYTTVLKINTDVVYSSRDSYVNYFTPVREVVEGIKENDDGFYRIEKNFFRTSNDAIALGMYGLSHSSSTMNEKAISFLEYFGITAHSHNTRYSGATPLIDDLFGIKYILSSKNNESHSVKTSEDVTVEENLDAMPLAYLTDMGLLQADLKLPADGEDRDNIFLPQSRMLAYMIGKRETPAYFPLINIIDTKEETDNLTKSVSGSHTVYKVVKSGTAAEIRNTVVSDRDGELFLWLPSDYRRRIDVSVERKDSEGNYYSNNAGGFFEADYYRVLSLGVFSEGEEFTLRFKLTKDEVYLKDIYVAGIDMDLYERDYSVLRSMNENTVVEKLSPVHLRITAESESDKLLFTTIPAEPGWTVTVNGENTDYQTALGALISVPLDAGVNVVEMRYTVNGYPFALFITLGGVILFVSMCVSFVLYRNHKKKMSEQQSVYDSYENTAADDDVEIDDFEDFDGEFTDFNDLPSDKVYIGEFDEESVLKNIESIVNDINEINSGEQLDSPDNPDSLDAEKEIKGALDLFPDDEIARLSDDDTN